MARHDQRAPSPTKQCMRCEKGLHSLCIDKLRASVFNGKAEPICHCRPCQEIEIDA